MSKKRKILVTGANGYLGRGVVKALLDRGNNVVATDFNCEFVDSRATKVEADLFSIDNPVDFFGNPDIVLHLAWRNGFIHNSGAHVDDLPSHVHFFEKLIDGGIKKIAAIGSMHEVGFFEGSIDETTPCNPLSYYGISKNALRQFLAYLSSKYSVNYQWLRCFYIVKNTEFGSSIFSKIVAEEKKGSATFPFTSGTNQYDFLDYDECCRLIALAVEQDAVLGVINICSGRPQKLADRVERFISENNFSIKLEYGKYPDRPYDSKAIWGNDKRIKEIIELSTDF